MYKPRLKLPAGTHTFELIRTEGQVYVDKTQYLVKLIDATRINFFARPRRFGKSLTVSTFEALFSGRRELFKGLHGEEFFDRPEFKPSPVIKLDMSKVVKNSGIEGVRESLIDQIKYIANLLDVSLPDSKLPGILFRNLIANAYHKNNEKVVILIDEYDAPYVEFVNNSDMAELVRGELRDCYIQMKANDEYIRFIFITGISKFARFGVFSTLNNTTDISLMPEYAGMCGLTEDEITQYFSDYIDDTAKKMNISTLELRERMKYYYNGFCFDYELSMRLYNPYSTVAFFGQKKFSNYWIHAGRAKVLSDYMKNKHLTVEQFRNFVIPEDFAESPGDVDTTSPEGFLYQCGYLTLREKTEDSFLLDYPNTEVLNSMSTMVTESILRDCDEDFSSSRKILLEGLREANYKKIVKAFNRVLASIPYVDYAKTARRVVDNSDFDSENDDEIYKKQREWLYRSNLVCFLRGCGARVIAEMPSNLGRSDMIIMHGGKTWVVELKVAYKDENPATKAQEAFRQIHDKNYATPYADPICIGMAIDDAKRLITEIRDKNEE